MIIEYIMPFIDGVMDIFSQGGIITYIILFVGIYGLNCLSQKYKQS